VKIITSLYFLSFILIFHVCFFTTHSMISKLIWSLVLLIPFPGILFYLAFRDPPKPHEVEHLKSPDEYVSIE
jgi:hypothetical protein